MVKRTRVTTGIAGLDEITSGGLPRNRMYLVQGAPGTGKTTLALRFLLEGVRLGEPGMYITLSESKEELLGVAEAHGLSLEGISIYDVAAKEENLTPDSHYTMFHPSEVELGDITKAILAEVKEVRPARVVFDSLSDMRLLAEGPLRYRRQVLGLKAFFAANPSTVLLLDEQPPEEGSRQLESLVHGVVTMEHNSPGYGGPRRRLRILKLREVDFVGGYHDLTIETGGLVVYPRLIAAQHHPQVKLTNFSSGIPELDLLTGGGLQFGTTTLFLGPAGAGKSIVATQYTRRAAEEGLKPTYFTFDEVQETLLTRAAGVGMDLRELVREGKCRTRQIDPAELMPGEFAGLIRDAVERDGSRVVVIDSLNGFYQSMPEERFLNAHMHELLSYLNQQGVLTILILTQQGMFGTNMPVPVDLSYLADAILLLRYFEYAGHIKQAISMVKKRSGFHERTVREFQISSQGVHLGDPLTQFQGVLTGVPSFTGSADRIQKPRNTESQ